MNKSLLMSLSLYWYYLIGEGKKTIEGRKTIPQDPDWNRQIECYMTKDKKSFARIPKELQEKYRAHMGKVGMRFRCDKADAYKFHSGLTMFGGELGLPIGTYDSYLIFEDDYKAMCLSYKEVKNYGRGNMLYGLHISNLKVYDKPNELGEFMRCQCKYLNENPTLFCDCYCEYFDRRCYEKGGAFIPLTRPPQSWMYIEEMIK